MIKTRRQAFMALLILEQLDLRVDQQWINMAATTAQSISIGMGYHILKDLFHGTALEDVVTHIQNHRCRLSRENIRTGFSVQCKNRYYDFMRSYCFLESHLFCQYPAIQVSAFKCWLKMQFVFWVQEKLYISS